MNSMREEIQLMRVDGKTFEEIGDHFSLSRQRIHQIYTGYKRRKYWKSENYKLFKRHQYHTQDTLLKKPCLLCIQADVIREKKSQHH